MYKKFTQETVLEMLEKNVLEIGQYVLADHYLIVGGKIADKVYTYLYDNGYCATMQCQCYQGNAKEYGAIEINR